MDVATRDGGLDWMLWPWRLAGGTFAPQSLVQPINPGWSFGNVVVTTNNSSAPDTERDIVAQHSYGRQIGRLMDVVQLLVEERKPGAKKRDPRLDDFEELRREIEQIKLDAAKRRVESLRGDLAAIEKSDPQAYARLRNELLDLLRR